MAYSCSHLYRLPVRPAVLRLRAWGRPDMAVFLFTKAIVRYPVRLFNHGRMRRDLPMSMTRRVLRLVDRAGKEVRPRPPASFTMSVHHPEELMRVSSSGEGVGPHGVKDMLPCSPAT
jgi:hypothetical protein